MTSTLSARNLKLHDLKKKFHLQQVDHEDFFPEWQSDLPELSTQERQSLDRVKTNYLYLLEYPVMESVVKMVVLSPLLDLAGYYQPPFRVDAEMSVRVSGDGTHVYAVFPSFGAAPIWDGSELKHFGALIVRRS